MSRDVGRNVDGTIGLLVFLLATSPVIAASLMSAIIAFKLVPVVPKVEAYH